MPGRLPARLTDAAAFLHESGNGGDRPAECADGETRLSERHELEKPERLDGVGLFTVLDLELK